MTETILTNARLVFENELVLGTLVFEGERIVSVDTGRSSLPAAHDLDGDFLAAGLIEMHTDNMEKHFVPRPGVFWPNALAAALAHDAQMAAAGVTTVYDSISCGSIYGHKDYRRAIFPMMIGAIQDGTASGSFRVDHRIHLRCEVPAEDIVADLEPHLASPLVHLASLMDHTPGQRQWRNIEHLKTYNLGSGEKTLEEFESDVAVRMESGPALFARNWPLVVDMLRERNIPLASHDDTTLADVDLAVDAGARISEFPTTPEAARYARACGLRTVAGEPNVVRGGSHSGGVSATELTLGGLLDGLSSDYVPSSLLQAVMLLHNQHGVALPIAMAMVNRNMADMLGLVDRGRIRAGLRADLLRFRMVDGTPVTRTLWCAGERAW
ncbi:MAG: alpha-D-ribose 1-methylphosphonate 5-triphosphate diphosphatase [Beijerinckiaceae bacterium]|nr:alpha-D-ribose 1-methylphosphonate 5-triphosphate diphosphatase [Beijerinckiaceae bacterium]